ncbi:DUF397 domain-containing protein [Streptomyces sp. NPDC002536]
MNIESELSRAAWRKSSYSGAGDEKGGDNCLEVADNIPGMVPVRDSKASRGPALAFPAQAWAAFVMDIRAEGADERSA